MNTFQLHVALVRDKPKVAYYNERKDPESSIVHWSKDTNRRGLLGLPTVTHVSIPVDCSLRDIRGVMDRFGYEVLPFSSWSITFRRKEQPCQPTQQP